MTELNRRSLFRATVAGAALAAAASGARAQTPPAAPGNGAQAASQIPQPDARNGSTFEHSGGRIFYQTMGRGTPLLLVHGYPLSGALFLRVADTLARSHTVILPDLRGYGKSHTDSDHDTVQTYAEDMLALMQHLGIDKATIGGMSMGGPTVLAMHKAAPERFSGLILIDTTAKNANPAEAGEWDGAAKMVQSMGPDGLLPVLLPVMLTGSTRMNDKTSVDYLRAIVQQCSKDAGVSGAKALANRPDASGQLPSIKVPTLVLVGKDDPLYSFEVAQIMQGQISGSTLHVVPGGAHASIFEKPDDAGGAIGDWLSKASNHG